MGASARSRARLPFAAGVPDQARGARDGEGGPEAFMRVAPAADGVGEGSVGVGQHRDGDGGTGCRAHREAKTWTTSPATHRAKSKSWII